jgi:hypothetical protein
MSTTTRPEATGYWKLTLNPEQAAIVGAVSASSVPVRPGVVRGT